MFTPAMYESINGFSNVFYGWGREDVRASIPPVAS